MRPIDLMPKSISDRNIYESSVIDDFIQSIGFNGYLYHASGCVPEIFPRSVTVTNGDEQTLDYFASHSPMSPEPLFKSQQNGFRNVYSAIKVRNKKGHTYEGRIASLKEIKYIPLRVISGIAAYFLLWSKSNIELDVTDSAARRILSVFHGMHAQIIVTTTEQQRGLEMPRLTRTEQRVLRWTAEGKTASEAAQILGVTERTINFHVANLISKLDASNKTHAIFKAVCFGIIL